MRRRFSVMHVRLDGGADTGWAHPRLAQSDGQILGFVAVDQRSLGGRLLGRPLDFRQVSWVTLGLGLELFLEHVHVQLLVKPEGGVEVLKWCTLKPAVV